MYRITDIAFELKRYEYYETFRITKSSRTFAENIEVKLILDDGAVGVGEASPSFRVNGEVAGALMAMEPAVRDMLYGLDVRNYRKIFDLMKGISRSAPSLKAAVEYATLDAMSVSAGVPVYMILGGAKDRVRTDKTVVIDSLENMVKKAVGIMNDGFRDLKIKVGENLREDIEKVVAIADATPGMNYVVDANQGYSPKEAVQFSQYLYDAGIDVSIFEQPVPWNDFEGLKTIRNASPFKIAVDEGAKTMYDVHALIKNDCVDAVNIKIMKSGISDALSIIELAKAANVDLMIGSMSESSIGISQSVHLAAGTGAFSHHDLDTHMLLREETNRGKFRQEGDFLIPLDS